MGNHQRRPRSRACLLAFFLVLVLPSSAWAASWSFYEARGDERMDGRQWSAAKEFYMKALGIAGDAAPRALWEKYNRAFSLTLEENTRVRQELLARERVARVHRPVVSGAPADTGVPTVAGVADGSVAGDEGVQGSSGVASVVTSSTGSMDATTVPDSEEGYVEIRPDGTVRMRLADYLAGARVTRAQATDGSTPLAGTAATSDGVPTATEGTLRGAAPTSFWREPLADTSGGRTQFGPSEKIGLSTVRSEADFATGAAPEATSILTPEYEVTGIDVRFVGSNKLIVTGQVTNRSKFAIRNARVYVRIYNDTGVFRGRKWSYLEPGRQTLNPGKTKRFEVEFFGFTGTVGSYKIEVVANFRR